MLDILRVRRLVIGDAGREYAQNTRPALWPRGITGDRSLLT